MSTKCTSHKQKSLLQSFAVSVIIETVIRCEPVDIMTEWQNAQTPTDH